MRPRNAFFVGPDDVLLYAKRKALWWLADVVLHMEEQASVRVLDLPPPRPS